MTQKVIIEDEFVEDEISISAILSKLWRRRGLILAVMLLSLGIGSSFILASATTKNTPITLFVELTNIKDGKYPNGSDFSPGDLKSPEVIEALTARFEIKDKVLLNQSLTVNYGTRSVLGLHESFKQRLSQKGLTSVDIQKITADYQQATNEASLRGLEITFKYQDTGLSKQAGEKLTSAVPLFWNEIYTKNHRTILDTSISDTISNVSHLALSSTSGLLEAERLMTEMKKGLQKLIDDTRFNTTTTESGKGPTDIIKDLSSFRNIYFTPLMARAFHTKDPISLSYARDLKLNINELDRNLITLDDLTKEIVDFRRTNISNDSDQMKQRGDNIQFSDNSLSEILKISNQASLSEYLKIILESKKDIAFKRASFQTDLDRFTATEYINIDETYIKNSEEMLMGVASEYSSLINRVKTRSHELIQSFYIPIGSPESMSSKWPDKSLLILALTTIMGLVLSVAVSLLLPEKHQHPKPRSL
jgi:hypothetical protein